MSKQVFAFAAVYFFLFFNHVGCVDTCCVAVPENWISSNFDTVEASGLDHSHLTRKRVQQLYGLR